MMVPQALTQIGPKFPPSLLILYLNWTRYGYTKKESFLFSKGNFMLL